MVKIVIFVAIVALACVNAQIFPGFPNGGIFDIFKQVKIPTPEEMINRKPGPNEHIQAHYVSSRISEDGKLHATMLSNIDGDKKSYSYTS